MNCFFQKKEKRKRERLISKKKKIIFLKKIIFFQKKERRKNFSKKKIFQNFIFQNFFRTTSRFYPLWKRYIGSLFKGPVTITQKTKTKKTPFQIFFFLNHHFSKLFSNYVWTWSSMRGVRRQPFQMLDHNHPKRNFIWKRRFFKTFFELRLDLILYERGT